MPITSLFRPMGSRRWNTAFFPLFEQIRGDHDVAVVFPRLPGECVLQRAFERNGVRHDVMRRFPGYRCLGQDREVEIAAVLFPGFFGHLVDQL